MAGRTPDAPESPARSFHPEDEDLMLRFQEEGSMSAFSELFRRHKDGFVDFLARLSGDRAIGEDLSQQVWLRLIDVARQGLWPRAWRAATGATSRPAIAS